MKSRALTYITATILFAALAIPLQLAAQKQTTHFRHYKLVDIDTFGGAASYVNFAANGRDINSQGVTIGDSATSIPAPSNTNPFGCLGQEGGVPFIFHAFEWRNGVVTDLGSLGDGSNCSAAQSINDKGEITGVSDIGVIDPATGFTEIRAVLWKDGKIENLGTFGGNHSAAGEINNRGQVAGFALNAISDPFSIVDLQLGSSNGTQTRAFLWEKEVMHDLGTLGGPDAIASFLNDRGQVAGQSYTNSTPNLSTGMPTMDPFLWQNGKMIDLGTLGGTQGAPNGLNNRGQVIGQSNLAGDPGCLTPNGCVTDVFLWSHGKMIDLTASTIGGTFLFATAINDAGEIVGPGAFPGHPFDAALWRNGVLTDLGTLDGDCSSLAENIDFSGRVVGESFSCDSSNMRAFVWKDGALIDLNALIPPDSPLQLVFGFAINDRGEIAGVGVPPGVAPADVNTKGHAFLLIPCDGNHPGIDGCDYSLVEASATATVNTMPTTRLSPDAIRQLPGSGRSMPWRRRFGAKPQK